jgi:cytochrome c-type biogenesis protein CcmH/NrfF
MKKTILKTALIAIALTAAGQSIRQAQAEIKNLTEYGDTTAEQRVQLILQKKAGLESQGYSLTGDDNAQLARDLRAVSKSLSLPSTMTSHESPGI